MPQAQLLWPRIVRKFRRIAYYPLDTYDLIVGHRPPNHLLFVGDGSWRAVGNEFLRHSRKLGLLQPDHHVLDVGSGIGRMAAPLTRFINGRGSYVGFDIVRSGIEWCQQNISARHGNFTFIHSDVFNKHYNPSGKIRASEFSFPVDERKFDFVLATSVFTHMLPNDLERYLSEISRLMKTGGRCLVTFFLMNDESRRGNRSGMSVFNFRDFSPQCSVVNMSDPEMAIAYDESYVRRQLRERGLALQEPIQYGSWSGRKDHLSFQDIVVAVKEPSRPAGND